MISEGYKHNFRTLQMAMARAGHVVLMECQDKATQKTVMTVCAVHVDDEGQYNFTPLAKMFDGNPYDELNPPNPDGGFIE
jgi:hypothetical protein